jgi:putative transposase
MRLKGYNCAQPGAYFITLITHQRADIFGEILEGGMQLSSAGKIVHEEMLRSNSMRREIRLNEDEFIVVPNHAHAIVWIVDPGSEEDASSMKSVLIDEEEGKRHALHQSETGLRESDAQFKRLPCSLSSFIAGFKSAVTGRARRELGLTDVWQRSYYDHIIRNEREFDKIWNYIDTNSLNWQEDQLHPSAPPTGFIRNRSWQTDPPPLSSACGTTATFCAMTACLMAITSSSSSTCPTS